MSERPRLLDLFCGAGGCTRGYQEAGFYVVGVDIAAQPNYCGDEYVNEGALAHLERLLWRRTKHGERIPFDAIAASPPCQLFSVSTVMHDRSVHLDLVSPTRDLLRQTGLPYVIENVPGAPLRDAVQVCGSGLGIVRLRRHRLFESNVPLMGAPCAHGQNRDIISVVGHSEGNGRTGLGYLMADKESAMGIDWMNRGELSQAIPPVYTRFIGEQLLDHLGSDRNGTPADSGGLPLSLGSGAV